MVLERFLRYVRFYTTSDESSDTVPSTARQRVLGQALADELTTLAPGAVVTGLPLGKYIGTPPRPDRPHGHRARRERRKRSAARRAL